MRRQRSIEVGRRSPQNGCGMDLFEAFHKFSWWLTRKILSPFEKPKVEGPPADSPVLGKYFKEVFGKPLTTDRRPEARDFTNPVEYYAEMHRAAVSLYDNSPS